MPYSVADFALKAANDQDNDVRKSAVNLAKTVKQKGGKQRLDSLLLDSSGVKESIAKQLVHWKSVISLDYSSIAFLIFNNFSLIAFVQ